MKAKFWHDRGATDSRRSLPEVNKTPPTSCTHGRRLGKHTLVAHNQRRWEKFFYFVFPWKT